MHLSESAALLCVAFVLCGRHAIFVCDCALCEHGLPGTFERAMHLSESAALLCVAFVPERPCDSILFLLHAFAIQKIKGRLRRQQTAIAACVC